MRAGLVVVALVLVAGEALAQEPRPTVTPFPLELRRVPSGFSKKDREDLQKIFPLLVRGAGAAVPDAARLSSSLLELKRQDCDREDSCLAQLAKISGSLYAVYVGVDYTLEKHVIVTGRVVRDDGVATRALDTIDIVKEGAFKDVARDGINQLLTKLNVGSLPSVREVAVVVKKDPDPIVVKKDPDPVVLPPPLPPVDTGKDQRTAGTALLVGGGGVVIVGAVFAGVGAGLGYGVTGGASNYLAKNEAEAQRLAGASALTGVGFVSMGVGGVAAAVGAVVLAMAPSAPVTSVTVVPTAGGGVVQLGGRF